MCNLYSITRNHEAMRRLLRVRRDLLRIGSGRNTDDAERLAWAGG
jgi:hypothetical protein